MGDRTQVWFDNNVPEHLTSHLVTEKKYQKVSTGDTVAAPRCRERPSWDLAKSGRPSLGDAGSVV